MMTIGSGLFQLFLAAVVVVHHSFPLRLGAWAVYAFFILSGFWISQMWRHRYAHTHNQLLTFMVSRWWRLAPIFLVCTALSVVSSFFLQGGDSLHGGNGPAWWLRQLLVAGSNGVGTDLPPSWSLDVEMQFYLVAPLLITFFGRIGPLLRCLIAAAACGWFALHIFRGGNVQLASLTLFVGFLSVSPFSSLQPEERSRVEAVPVPGDELFRGGTRGGDSSSGRGSTVGTSPGRVRRSAAQSGHR